MTLVVEDGTGIPNSNSYVTVAEIDEYFVARNVEDWSNGAGDEEKTGYALLAMDYLNAAFTWRGDIVNVGQKTAIPTSEILVVPEAVKTAQILLAKEAASGAELAPALGAQVVASTREKLEGVGEIETKYQSTVDAPYAMNSIIFGLIRAYVYSAGSKIQVARRDYA